MNRIISYAAYIRRYRLNRLVIFSASAWTTSDGWLSWRKGGRQVRWRQPDFSCRAAIDGMELIGKDRHSPFGTSSAQRKTRRLRLSSWEFSREISG